MNQDKEKKPLQEQFPTPEEIPAEQQDRRPGSEEAMRTKPVYDLEDQPGYGRLKGKVALITGGDSGIGRAVAVAYAKEGAKVVIVYKDETKDARETMETVEKYGAGFFGILGDIGDPAFCREAVQKAVKKFGGLDILVNNAAEQHPVESIEQLSDEQLERTFRTNIFAMFYLVKAALPHLKPGSAIINTSSVTAYKGNPTLLDYSSTKGAITSFTRSLSLSLAEKQIRVNAVVPGPIWTPLIPSTFGEEKVDNFGADTPMKRAGQPVELAEAYVFLAWDRASSYITGQAIHIGGGQPVES